MLFRKQTLKIFIRIKYKFVQFKKNFNGTILHVNDLKFLALIIKSFVLNFCFDFGNVLASEFVFRNIF